jgi:hypothetical protein
VRYAAVPTPDRREFPDRPLGRISPGKRPYPPGRGSESAQRRERHSWAPARRGERCILRSTARRRRL